MSSSVAAMAMVGFPFDSEVSMLPREDASLPSSRVGVAWTLSWVLDIFVFAFTTKTKTQLTQYTVPRFKCSP